MSEVVLPGAVGAVLMMGQIPTPASGEIERWLISGAAVMAMIVLAKKLFVRRPPIEAEFMTKEQCERNHDKTESAVEMRWERIDARFTSLEKRMDDTRADILTAFERSRAAMHARINDLSAMVVRLDERSHKEKP